MLVCYSFFRMHLNKLPEDERTALKIITTLLCHHFSKVCKAFAGCSRLFGKLNLRYILYVSTKLDTS